MIYRQFEWRARARAVISVSIDLNKLRVTTTSLSTANLFTGYLYARIPRSYYRAALSSLPRLETKWGPDAIPMNARNILSLLTWVLIFSINPIRPILSTTKSIDYHVNYAHTPHVILYTCFILHVNLGNSNNQITCNNYTCYSRYRNAGIIQMRIIIGNVSRGWPSPGRRESANITIEICF